MRKITVLSMITLDGVLQGGVGPKEDPSGGFKYGGWVAPFMNDEYGKVVEEELKPADYLLGRKTFKIWEAYWPKHAEFWPGINEGTKYVMSKTVKKTAWRNTVFIKTKGLPLFMDVNDRTILKLTKTKTFGSGAILLTYETTK